ncbi:MAG: relaxase [Chromatiaceae bacterium]|nr:MAG: relaxase [Chromatiaceae bacterium]
MADHQRWRLFARRPPDAAAPPAALAPVPALPSAAPPPAPHPDPAWMPAAESVLEVPRYPPFRRGLPVAPVARLLADQQALCQELSEVLALTDAEYSALLAPVLARFAAYVHLLPASEHHHHRGGGGLLRHALEVAMLTAKAARQQLFAADRDRYRLEGRWQLAAAVAGLLHDIGKPVVDLTVVDRTGAHEWNPYTTTLLDWAQGAGVPRYYLRWRAARQHNAHEAAGNLVLRHVLTAELETWLGADPAIIAAMIGAISANPGSRLSALVRAADAESVQRDLREERLDPCAFGLGVPVDRHLIDAMRRLTASGQWTVNQPGARLWMLPDGLHLVWPDAGEDIYRELARDQVPGIPRSPETLADILVERGHVATFSAEGRDGRFYRRITIDQDGKPVTLRMLLLDHPDLIYAGRQPPLVVQPLASQPPQQADQQAAQTAPTEPWAAASDLSAGTEDDAEDEDESASLSMGDRQPSGPAAESPPCASQADACPPAALPDASSPQPEPSSAAPPQASDADAQACAHRDWLAHQGAAGAWLLEHIDRFAAAAIGPDPGLHDDGSHLWVRDPDGLAGDETDAAKHARDLLWTGKLIAVQPQRPYQRTRERDGTTWIVLTPTCSRHLRALLAAPAPPEQPPVPAPDATPATPAAGAAASSRPPRGSRKSGGNADTRLTSVIARVRAGQIPAEHLPQGWLLETDTITQVAAELGWPAPVLVRRLGYLGVTPNEHGLLIPH